MHTAGAGFVWDEVEVYELEEAVEACVSEAVEAYESGAVAAVSGLEVGVEACGSEAVAVCEPVGRGRMIRPVTTRHR